jgi:hypothetical protein
MMETDSDKKLYYQIHKWTMDQLVKIEQLQNDMERLYIKAWPALELVGRAQHDPR